MPDVGDKLRAVFEPMLEAGETLEGMCVGSRSGFMSSKFVVFAVTGRRLIVQETNRKQEPKGDPLSVGADEVASSNVGGAGGFGGDAQSAILNKTGIAFKLKTTDGQKLKLMAARGGGPLGGLMGGQVQEDGVRAVTEWLARNGSH